MLSDDVKQLLTEVAELARRLARLPVEAQAHLDSITVSVLALFDRCRSTFGAVLLLLKARFVHEAVLLGRPLFTESLMLAEWAAAEERRRKKLVVGWWLKSIADHTGLLLEAQARGDDVSGSDVSVEPHVATSVGGSLDRNRAAAEEDL
jgi:hypothetical protein